MKKSELRQIIKEEIQNSKIEYYANELAKLLNKYQPKIAGYGNGGYFKIAPGYGLAKGDLTKKFPGFGDSIDIINILYYSLKYPEAHKIVNKLTNGKYIIRTDISSQDEPRSYEDYYFEKIK
jgi:hypothetical protein